MPIPCLLLAKVEVCLDSLIKIAMPRSFGRLILGNMADSHFNTPNHIEYSFHFWDFSDNGQSARSSLGLRGQCLHRDDVGRIARDGILDQVFLVMFPLISVPSQVQIMSYHDLLRLGLGHMSVPKDLLSNYP